MILEGGINVLAYKEWRTRSGVVTIMRVNKLFYCDSQEEARFRFIEQAKAIGGSRCMEDTLS